MPGEAEARNRPHATGGPRLKLSIHPDLYVFTDVSKQQGISSPSVTTTGFSKATEVVDIYGVDGQSYETKVGTSILADSMDQDAETEKNDFRREGTR